MMFLLCLSDSDRLLKNGHLLRFPHLSSLRRTVKYASLLKISGAPANGISQGSTCICLPARSRFGEGRALFEQPGEKYINTLVKAS